MHLFIHSTLTKRRPSPRVVVGVVAREVLESGRDADTGCLGRQGLGPRSFAA